MTITSDTNITEELLYAAQKIVSFYGDTLQSKMCLVQVPISALLEAQEYIDRAAVYNDADKINGKSIDELQKDLNKFAETPIAAAIRNRARQHCFNCKLEFPKINGKLFKDGLLSDISAFLKNGNNLFKRGSLNGALPNLVMLLSFLCLPDLLKLLALLLARLSILLSVINLGNFNLAGFIMAIIGKILSKLFSFLNAMIEIGMSPILCIFEALKTFTELVPAAVKDIEDFGNNAISKSVAGAKKMKIPVGNWEGNSSAFDAFSSAMGSVGSQIPKTNPIDVKSIKEQYAVVDTILQESINSMSDQVQNLLGLKTYFECEAKRNGTSFATQVEGIMNLIGLINLIKQIIKRKSENIAYAQYTGATVPSRDFTIDDIATVISNTIDQEVSIASADNTDIGIVIGKSQIPNVDNMDIFKCNMIDFINNSDYNQIISDAANITNTYGDGLEPSIPRVSLDDIFTNGDYTFVQINRDNINNAADEIKAIIDYLGAVSVPQQDQSVPIVPKSVNTGKINIVNTSINIKDIDIGSISTKLHQLS